MFLVLYMYITFFHCNLFVDIIDTYIKKSSAAVDEVPQNASYVHHTPRFFLVPRIKKH